jgi:hypothetical protein
MYLSVGWFLVSWWPHDNLHLHNGFDLQGLLYIEYGFHVTLIFAAFVLAYSLLTLLRPEETGADPSGRRAARVHWARVEYYGVERMMPPRLLEWGMLIKPEE